MVKAKALGMDGEHTEKNVAVKMLKSKMLYCKACSLQKDSASDSIQTVAV